jgi:alkylhydroperoxidase/carboxymuconolactone decarboxylase family protein YurZ
MSRGTLTQSILYQSKEKPMAMSAGWIAFMQELPEAAQAWLDVDRALSAQSALDARTAELAYLSVLAALGFERGIPFHVAEAKRLGASRAEVRSAILVGLPAAGARTVEMLGPALAAFDAD